MKATVLLLALVVLLAACGGSGAKPMTKAAYIKAVASIGAAARRGRTLKPVCNPKEPSGSDLFVIRLRFHTPAPQTLSAAASELAKLHPPAAVVAAHRDLVQGVRDAATALLPLTNPRSCKGVDVRAVFDSLEAATRQTQRAHKEFERAGFHFRNGSLTT